MSKKQCCWVCEREYLKEKLTLTSEGYYVCHHCFITGGFKEAKMKAREK